MHTFLQPAVKTVQTLNEILDDILGGLLRLDMTTVWTIVFGFSGTTAYYADE